MCCPTLGWSQKLEAPAGGSSFGGPGLSLVRCFPSAVILLLALALPSPALLRSGAEAAVHLGHLRAPHEAVDGGFGRTNAPLVGAWGSPIPASPTQSTARRSQGTVAAAMSGDGSCRRWEELPPPPESPRGNVGRAFIPANSTTCSELVFAACDFLHRMCDVQNSE